jgi:hypothetical protein
VSRSWNERRPRRSAKRHALGLAATLLLGASLPVPVAHAQDADSSRREAAASDLFERGKAKRAAGDYEAAASLFAASFREQPQAGTLVLLAEAYEHLGKLKSAHDTYLHAEQLADKEQDASLAHAAHTRGAALSPRIAQLEIRVATPLPRGLLVTLNGVEVPDSWLNNPVPLDNGYYKLEAFAPEHEPFVLNVQVVNHAAQTLGPQLAQVVLVASRSTAAAAPDGVAPVAPADAAGFDQRDLALWIGGAGLAVGAVGVILGLVAKSNHSDASCDAENVCDTQDDVDERSDAITLAHVGTGFGIAGLVGIGAGVTLYFTADDEDSGTSAVVGWTGRF